MGVQAEATRLGSKRRRCQTGCDMKDSKREPGHTGHANKNDCCIPPPTTHDNVGKSKLIPTRM